MTEDPKLDAFLFLAPGLKELIGLYTGLTGRASMPPKWALGAWMSRCQYENRQQVDEVLERLRAERIPCDVVHLDPLWMKTHYYYRIGVDACDFVRNEEGFPDLPGIFREYRDKGFNTCLWINPYIPEGTPIYEEAEKHGYLLKSSKGGLARLEHGNPVGMVDFSNPDALQWWKGYLRELARDGASVFKPDYGDRTPEDAVFHNGRSGREMHNLFLYHFTRAPYDVVKEIHGEGIVWRRAGYIGSQRFPGTWAGDTQVSWKGMRGCFRGGLSAGLTGDAFWSHDIGGFCGPAPSEEMYCRWAQFGMLSPLTRFHGTTPREPWYFGDTAMKVVKRYARLRYSLIPYLLACAEQSCATGVPIMRHMALEFPQEPNVDTLDDQYMLGDSLLVAPVMGDGKRSRPVYFPKGTWYAFGRPAERVEGGRFVTVRAPLDHMPLYVRAGSVIPRYIHNPQHLKDGLPSRLGVDIYPGGSGRVGYTDEGQLFDMRTSKRGKALTVAATPAPVSLTVNLLGMNRARVSSRGTRVAKTSSKAGTSVTVDATRGVKLTVT
jgi:alpha-D-xyloside xylohydrolase